MDRRQFLLAALAACSAPKTRVLTRPVRSLAERLAALAVTDDDFYRSVLYTWTGVDGIARLRESKTLLVASATDGGFVSPFVQWLFETSKYTGRRAQLAKVLSTHPSLIRRRYAWTAPFATVMGLGKRTYGTSLIRIELRPQAWIGRFEPGATEPFSFVDARGKPVSLDDVLVAPTRIGAMFHVHLDPPFREYVIPNEAMIRTWSIATPEIRAKLDEEAALLRDVRGAGFTPGELERPALPSWRHRPTELAALWQATLAFDTDRYKPRPAQLDAILAALAAYDPAGPPLVHAPAYSARRVSHSSSSAT